MVNAKIATAKKMGLTIEQYDYIHRIFSTFLPQVQVLVFGSRARGNFKKYSDLDLALDSKSPINPRDLSIIRENFSQSRLPFKIDLVELTRLDSDFKTEISKDLKPL